MLNKVFAYFFLASLKSSILFFSILLMRQVLKNRLSPFFQNRMWIAVLPLAYFPLQMTDVVQRWADGTSTPASFSTGHTVSSANSTVSSLAFPISAGKSHPNYAISIPDIANNHLGFFRIITLLWILVTVFLLVVYLLINAHEIILLKHYGACEDKRILPAANYYKARFHVNGNFQIICNSQIQSAGVFGLLFPCVLFPKDLVDSFPSEKWSLVLAHEISHIKRRDNLWSLIFLLSCIVNWYNPLFWYAFFKFREDCEIACDAYMIHVVGDHERKSYGHVILDMLENRAYPKRQFFHLAGFSSSFSKRRIIMLANKSNTSILSVTISVLIFVMAGCASASVKSTSNSQSDRSTTPTSTSTSAGNTTSSMVSTPDISSALNNASQSSDDSMILDSGFKKSYPYKSAISDGHVTMISSLPSSPISYLVYNTKKLDQFIQTPSSKGIYIFHYEVYNGIIQIHTVNFIQHKGAGFTDTAYDALTSQKAASSFYQLSKITENGGISYRELKSASDSTGSRLISFPSASAVS